MMVLLTHKNNNYLRKDKSSREDIALQGEEAIGNLFEILPKVTTFAITEMEYKNIITPKMRAVADSLIDSFVGMDHCITGNGRNLIVEVPKSMCEQVRRVLKQKFEDVALIRNAYLMIEDLHDYILIKPLVSEAPLFKEDGILVPSLEKLLVDHDADKEYASLTSEDIQKEYQLAFEAYPVNVSRLLRYAGRKGRNFESCKSNQPRACNDC